mmetsp:Transcript_15283/g.31500  ORF Transcript_15283/g.31500 Transcript_15283/m.31500 type:complete len:271 (+) Transcript_15283:187-999(+)
MNVGSSIPRTNKDFFAQEAEWTLNDKFERMLNTPEGQEALQNEIRNLEGEVERGEKKIKIKETLWEDIMDRMPVGVKSTLDNLVGGGEGDDDVDDDDDDDDNDDSSSSSSSSSGSDSESDYDAENDVERGDEGSSSDEDSDASSDEEEESSDSEGFFGALIDNTVLPLYDAAVNKVALPVINRITQTSCMQWSNAILAFVHETATGRGGESASLLQGGSSLQIPPKPPSPAKMPSASQDDRLRRHRNEKKTGDGLPLPPPPITDIMNKEN